MPEILLKPKRIFRLPWSPRVNLDFDAIQHGKNHFLSYPIACIWFPSVATEAFKMSRKSRDFYHIQDKLPLAWRYGSTSGM